MLAASCSADGESANARPIVAPLLLLGEAPSGGPLPCRSRMIRCFGFCQGGHAVPWTDSGAGMHSRLGLHQTWDQTSDDAIHIVADASKGLDRPIVGVSIGRVLRLISTSNGLALQGSIGRRDGVVVIAQECFPSGMVRFITEPTGAHHQGVRQVHG